MKLLVTFFGLLATTLATSPCVCNRMLDPVCGSDGVTYGNPCMLDCEKATNNPDLTTAHEGDCSDSIEVSDEIPCICNRMYLPVCGSDGVTYGNICELECDQKSSPNLMVSHNGECTETKLAEEQSPCICNRMYLPVCGSDGVTYGNPCELECEQKTSPNLIVAHSGECSESKEEPTCFCNKIYIPVCGSDGVTYGNPCEFECEQLTNPTLRKDYDGECTPAPIFAAAKESAECVCTREYKPVCGSDMHTYTNECLFNCAAKKNPSLKLIYRMLCVIFNKL